jgi:hypothetical protein
MEFKLIVKPDGKIVTEVVDRQGEDCRLIHRVSDAIQGRDVSDERIGPDCDRVEEINT